MLLLEGLPLTGDGRPGLFQLLPGVGDAVLVCREGLEEILSLLLALGEVLIALLELEGNLRVALHALGESASTSL